MITVIEKGINPILNQYEYPELKVKIGLDAGESVIVQYGHDKSSLIDILGYSMNISAKITSLTYANRITIREDIYNTLNPQMRTKFKETNKQYHTVLLTNFPLATQEHSLRLLILYVCDYYLLP